MRVLAFPLALLLLAAAAQAYPAIISSPGVNHSQVKALVYSIPEQEFKDVDSIEFLPEPIRMFGEDHGGRYKVNVVSDGGGYGCYGGKIWIHAELPTLFPRLMFNRLQHELGHIHGICNHQDNSEEYAWNYQVNIGGENP